MNNLLESIFKNKNGFIVYSQFNDKDKTKVSKIIGSNNISNVIAYKDLSSMFKTQGVVFTTTDCIGPKVSINLVSLQSFKHISGDKYEYAYNQPMTASINKDFGDAMVLYMNGINELYETGRSYYNKRQYNEAFPYFHTLYNLNYKQSKLLTACCHEAGTGEVRNVEKALIIFDELFPTDEPELQSEEGLLKYGDSFFNNKYYLQSFICYNLATAFDSAVAYYNIGHLYHYGKGFDVDYKLAEHYYEKAISLDKDNQKYHHRLALVCKELKDYLGMSYHLKLASSYDKNREFGYLYEYGEGRKKEYPVDLDKALQYYLEAAKENADQYVPAARVAQKLKKYDLCFEYASKAYENKNYNALFFLGNCYEYGQGTEMDLKKAYECYKEGEPKSYPCTLALGRCYRDGIYIEKDLKEASRLLEECVNANMTQAYHEFFKLHKDNNNIDEAINIYKRGITKQNLECSLSLAEYYENISKINVAAQILEEATKYEKGYKAKITFIRFIIKYQKLFNLTDIRKYLDVVSHGSYDDNEYVEAITQYKKLHVSKFADKYIKGKQFEPNGEYFKVCVYFYEDKNFYYFIDVKTLEVRIAYPIKVNDFRRHNDYIQLQEGDALFYRGGYDIDELSTSNYMS